MDIEEAKKFMDWVCEYWSVEKTVSPWFRKLAARTLVELLERKDKKMMDVQIGDTVRAWKWVFDTDYSAIGVVDAVNTDKIGRRFARVNGDWYQIANDLNHRFEIIKKRSANNNAPG